MRDLEIAWQRLVDEKGETRPRCHGTGRWVRLAVHAPLRARPTR